MSLTDYWVDFVILALCVACVLFLTRWYNINSLVFFILLCYTIDYGIKWFEWVSKQRALNFLFQIDCETWYVVWKVLWPDLIQTQITIQNLINYDVNRVMKKKDQYFLVVEREKRGVKIKRTFTSKNNKSSTLFH